MPALQFSRAVHQVARPVPVLTPQDSLWRAAIVLREGGTGISPVVENGQIVGALSQSDLLKALESGADPIDAVATWMDREALTARTYDSCGQVARALARANADAMIVTDDLDRPVGVVTVSDLVAPADAEPERLTVGGMATPFGVYLTNGTLRAGVGPFALMTTGAILFLTLLAADAASTWLLNTLDLKATPWTVWAQGGLSTLLFLIGLRLQPLAGMHAAEHMVVHAVERGEPLVPEVVKRMPRVHPRCGTNFAVGAALFFSISELPIWNPPQVGAGVGLLAALLLWRKAGGAVQWLFTTRPPTNRQVAKGIEAGSAMLRVIARRGHQSPTLQSRLISSGIFQVMAGSTAVYLIVWLVAKSFGVDLME